MEGEEEEEEEKVGTTASSQKVVGSNGRRLPWQLSSSQSLQHQCQNNVWKLTHVSFFRVSFPAIIYCSAYNSEPKVWANENNVK